MPRTTLNGAVLAIQMATCVTVCLMWESASRLGWLDPSVVPSFLVTTREMGSLLADHAFIRHGSSTLGRVALAFIIAVPIAFGLGLAASAQSMFGKAVDRMINFLMSIPQSIFLPLFMLILGTGLVQKVTFGATHVIFLVAVITAASIRSIPSSYSVAARSFGASPLKIAIKVYLPAMFPNLLGAMRLGLLYGILGVILAEMYASRDGIGMLMNQWGEDGNVVRLNAALLIVSLATIVANETLRHFESKVSHWRKP